MTQFHTHRFASVQYNGHYTIASSTVGMSDGKLSIHNLPIIAMLVFSLLAFTSLISAGEDGVTLSDDVPMPVEEHTFEVVNIKWNDFTFSMPLPIGETYKIDKGSDADGFDDFVIMMYDGSGGYRALFLPHRSLAKDFGEDFNDTRIFFQFCEKNNQLNELMLQILPLQEISPKEYTDIVKVCDLDNAIIFQAKTLSVFKQYTKSLLVSIGVMQHDLHSYYFFSVDGYADDPAEWDNFFSWNKRFAELQ